MASAVSDHFSPGSSVAASLHPTLLDSFDPILRRLLGGIQVFVKQPDGRWRPRGCELGLARCFAFEDLQSPSVRDG